MAPKKADAKGKDAKGKDAKGQEEPSNVKEILKKPSTMAATVAFTLLLIIGACAVIALFFSEEKKHEDDRNALTLLRDFVIGNNESLKKESDTFIIESAYNFMKELTIVRDKNEELRSLTEALNKDIQWQAAGPSRFFLSSILMSRAAAVKFCIDLDSVIAKVIGEDVQTFLEKKAADKQRSYWIGLKTNSSAVWYWNDNEPVITTYWAPNKPENVQQGATCGLLNGICTPFKCWTNMYCQNRFGVICMRKRDPRWMD